MAGSLASGGIGINLINIPASLSGVANSKSWIVDRLLPSTTTTRDIEVSNTTSKPIKVLIYSGAATNIDVLLTCLQAGPRLRLHLPQYLRTLHNRLK